jgi:hypothetical protein
VKSVENEINLKIAELKLDFPDIESYVKKIKLALITEWLQDYKDRSKKEDDQFDFGWENEDGDPHFICP